ncbi:MAG: DUF4404 family protein [Arenicellales bacterium]|nr:DUF4404 family protein [Arenicellales bacterium]
MPAADHSARDYLNTLAPNLETRLELSGEERHDTLVNNVQESIRQLEGEHPRTTRVLNHIMMALSDMGI